MSTASAGGGLYGWLTGVGAGIVGGLVTGLVIQFAFDPAIISAGIPAVVGASGLLAGWIVLLAVGVVAGLVYAGIGTADRLAEYFVRPNTGAVAGLVFGLALWVAAAILVPLLLGAPGPAIGEYAITLSGVLIYALFGLVIGIVYGVSPYTG